MKPSRRLRVFRAFLVPHPRSGTPSFVYTRPPRMTPEAFETHLRQLDRHATLVRTRTGRETWRFTFNDKPYYLHFYPQGSKLSASDGPKEYAGLKTLQDFKIPAVRVVAMMSGYQFGARKGNAVITQGLEPAVRLSEMRPTPRERRAIVDQMIAILVKMTEHDVGYDDLSLDAFLWHEGRVLVLDGVGVRSEVLTTDQLMQFVHNADPFSSRADRVRAWRAIKRDEEALPPIDTSRAKRFARDLKRDAIERVRIGEWSGWFKSHHDRALEYSVASRLRVTKEDWAREWPRLVERMRGDQLDILKRDASGDILAGEANLQGRPIDVIVKRPRNKYLYRRVLGAFRASRAKRLFDKTRWLMVRRIDVEYPLIVMERRAMGYVVESVAIFEKVPGSTLDHVDLDALDAGAREDLFRACGRVLRKIEDTGLTHTDAKSSNWIVFHAGTTPASPKRVAAGSAAGDAPTDERPRAAPVLIDAYGIRPLNAFLQLFGIQRLLRAMKKHPQYTPIDSLHICRGFSPRAMLKEEQA
jgi:tRNA A-37 threonylcarbamoyl transferase component Bud32